MSKTVAFIFARAGSKGLPGKNIRLLNGCPLIVHSINFAKSCPEIADVVVSTDSGEIAEIARLAGATVPFLRPQHLASDIAPEREAWRHAVRFYLENISDFEIFLSLPAVSPLREKTDVKQILEKLAATQADMVLSAYESDASPYSNLIENKDGLGFKLCSGGGAIRRQEAKPVYRIIPMYYACSTEAVFRLENVFDGRVELFEIPRFRAVDVDTLEDFEYLEFLIRKRMPISTQI